MTGFGKTLGMGGNSQIFLKAFRCLEYIKLRIQDFYGYYVKTNLSSTHLVLTLIAAEMDIPRYKLKLLSGSIVQVSHTLGDGYRC